MRGHLLFDIIHRMANDLHSNVFNTALLFEGGSMRAAYTCAVAAELLDQGVYFDNVYGVSAGSSNTANYVSRDIDRTIASFTSFVQMPNIGSWKTLATHKGLWNAQYIYQEAGKPDGIMPFDFETFSANPAKATIVSFERDTGRDLFFRKDEIARFPDVSAYRNMIVFSLVPEEAARVGVRVDGGEVDSGKDGIRVERSFEFDVRT